MKETVFIGPRRNEFRRTTYGRYPPPQFSQFGGNVPDVYNLAITNEKGIYYTTDGSDPRELSKVNPNAINQSGSSLDVTIIPLKSVWKCSDTDGDLAVLWRDLNLMTQTGKVETLLSVLETYQYCSRSQKILPYKL